MSVISVVISEADTKEGSTHIETTMDRNEGRMEFISLLSNKRSNPQGEVLFSEAFYVYTPVRDN